MSNFSKQLQVYVVEDSPIMLQLLAVTIGVAEKPEAEGIQRKRGHTAILARWLSNLWPCGFNESLDF